MMSAHRHKLWNKSTATNPSLRGPRRPAFLMTATTPVRLLILGAHPDDAKFHAGGLAPLWAQQGGAVKIVSVTNGEAGHHQTPGPKLVERRRTEAAAAAGLI